MKTLFFLLFLSANVALAQNNAPKASAIADQQEGLYIFMFSKPTSEYEYLGNLKIEAYVTGAPNEMLPYMIKHAKKKYPNGNAIIFTSEELDRVDVVRIKDK